MAVAFEAEVFDFFAEGSASCYETIVSNPSTADPSPCTSVSATSLRFLVVVILAFDFDLALGCGACFVSDSERAKYLREGLGSVYFTGQRDNRGELIVKWGETSCLSRRQLEYKECGGAGQTQMWFVAFEVQRRLLAERVIRLGLIGQGYGRVRFEEPCSCGTSHCEYHWMRLGGSLEEIETIARESLAIIGEPMVIRKNLRPRRRCARYSADLLRFRRR
ncbi:hypothetical protein B0H14DRAFT_2574481 [Mycena olivaceomarginata]|nr:hypothetical protein B0H14DRAFT_2574481 [Mycena olivaceomarginata]